MILNLWIYTDGLAQDCSNSSALAMELLQFCNKLSISCWLCCHFLVIQIKICAEYRVMLPWPRLVCQEPGLRPIGLCTDLNLFYSIHFPNFFHSSVDLVGNFAGLTVCTVPSAIVHCNQNDWSSDNQSSQHALLRCSWAIKTLSGI